MQKSFFYILCLIVCFASCNNSNSLFKKISSDKSGIHFNNKIIESDSVNVLDFENVYNGGGVGIGDFNNDGLQDIYFTGNMVSNKLYLNKGNLKFDDITKEANVDGKGRWCRGVAVVDINNDGWQDLYVCASVKSNAEERQNLLYINQGLNKDGIPVFKEMGKEYGLNDTTHSTMATFFDYDNDGDLDVYIVANQIIHGDYPNRFRPRMLNGEHPSTGKLYRNDWSDSLKHPVFTDVSKQAGITIEGYGHNAAVTDINKDGWKDILVSNDYLSNDILYINNHNGTFTDKVTSYFKHTSANAMGTDVNDINNDGLQDIVELDMNPQDNYRKKMMMNANSYQTYQNSDYFGYQYQYVRNTLQLNQGARVNQKDSIGDPIFSDIAFLAGIAETDWSWSPMIVDFDNDGFRDLIITNGFPKDVTDHDFIAFRNQAFSVASKKQLLEQIPAVKIPNYAFHNNGNLTFTNVSSEWGLTTPSFSNGAAYADFDNDGDMDLVVNNINDEVFVYENTLMDDKKNNNNHYLSVKLIGDSLNRDGLGAWIELYYQGKQQVYEENPYRGYLSSVQKEAHFGLGDVNKLDSLVIKWPTKKKQVLKNISADQLIKVNIVNADLTYTWDKPILASNTLFREITDSIKINYVQKEIDYIDFNIQKLLPHKFSEYGPALAVGDVDGNGLDDIVIGGSFSYSATILLQQKNGLFIEKSVIPNAGNANKRWEDMGITLFDVDGDGDLDMYIASGGYENQSNTEAYQDKLYINDGKGNFAIAQNALPQNFTSKSCVRAADFDNDGDLDLFIAGRVEPWKYPQPVASFIYRNDSKSGVIKFTDVTDSVAKSLNKIGMICDAVWTDFDNDGWQDLVLTGEWMPIKFLKNDKGIFKDITATTGISNMHGWWTSIIPGDFDNDGKMDYIVGNLGLNSFYRASEKYPVKIYAKDFDNNGSYDAVPTIFLPTSQTDPSKKEYPVHTRDDMAKQMIMFRSKFQNYKTYATAPFNEMFTKEELKDVLILNANYFENSFLKNLGNGKFQLIPLPTPAQYSCMNGMMVEDFDGDGNLDILVSGNDFSTEVSVGRYDASNGLFLKGNGKGDFKPLSILQSGWFVPGNGKALVKLKSSSGKCLLAASENKGPLKIFELKKNIQTIQLQPEDVSVIVQYKNGIKQKREISYGASFLSQSSRFINIDSNIMSVQIKDYKGDIRNLKIH